jgi:hypothetical protein
MRGDGCRKRTRSDVSSNWPRRRWRNVGKTDQRAHQTRVGKSVRARNEYSDGIVQNLLRVRCRW